MLYSNTLNLIQVGGGTQVKQGDLGSRFSYKLANEKDQVLTNFDEEVAHINLVLNDKIVFTTTATVDNSTVTFNIDKAIPVGLYFLEIKIRDYIFPSDKQTIIFVQSGAVAYDLKELVPNYDTNMTISGILSDLSKKGIDIKDLKTKMNAIYNNALADHAEITTARGVFDTLSNRLSDINHQIQNVASGSPKGIYANLSELQSAKPNGDSGIYVTADNGHWYYYSDGWRDGGTYQATELADGSVTPQKIASDYDAISELKFEVGTINSSDGTVAPDNRRIRSWNFIKVKAGYNIKVLNNAFSFGVFTYQSPNTANFIGAEAVWYKSFTIKQDCYIRLTVAFDSNSTDIANYTTSVPSIIAIPDSGTLVYKSTDIKNGIVTESHLSAELQNKINSTPNVVDLVMMMGQSNMAGRGITSSTYPQTAPTVPEGKGYEFRAISDPTKLYQIVEPFGVNENNAASGVTETTKTGSMVSAFANEYYDKTGVPIVAVSCSKGGTSISWWQPSGLPLQDAIARFKKAESWLLSNGYTIRHRYMVWCQGETDGDNAMTGETYKLKFLAMVNAMFAEGIEKCFVVRIGNHRDNATVYNPIIQAQTELAKETENVVLVSTKFDKMATDGLMKDTFHYYQHGYNIVGADAGRNAAFYVKTGKEPTMYDWENKCLYFSHK